MINRKIINVLLVPFITVPAFGATTVSTDGSGAVTVKSCESYKDKSVVKFKVGSNGIEQGVLAHSGCATQTYSAGLVKAGNNIIISGENGPTTSTTIPKDGNSGPSTGSSSGSSSGSGSAGETPQQQDTRKTEPDAKLRSTARDAANRFANLMVNNMGNVENIRYNLFRGFREAEAHYSIFGENYVGFPEYSQGFSTGRKSGTENGFAAGSNEGRSVGKETANNDVVALFEGAMVTGQRPAAAPKGALNINFGGLNANMSAPTSIEDRMNAKEPEMRQKLRRMTMLEDGIIIGEDIYVSYYKLNELRNLREYNFDYILGSYRAERAFEAWRTNVFNDHASTDGYYKRVTDSSEYKDAEQNKSIFYREFINQYDDVIAKKWNAAVTRDNPIAKEMGRAMYEETLKEYVFDLGKYAGYSAAYKKSSIDGYASSLFPSYVENYKNTYNTFATSAVITDVDFTAVAGTQNGTLALGDSVLVVLKTVANKGMADGQVQISVSAADDALKITQARNSLPIKSLTRISKPSQYNMAYFSKMKTPDQDVRINIDINGKSRTLSIRASFEALVARVAQSKDPALTASALAHMVGFLKAEYQGAQARLTNGYANPGNMLIGRLARAMSTLSASEKAQLASMKTQIRAAFGERPGWFGGLRDDYDSAIAILTQAGL